MHRNTLRTSILPENRQKSENSRKRIIKSTFDDVSRVFYFLENAHAS